MHYLSEDETLTIQDEKSLSDQARLRAMKLLNDLQAKAADLEKYLSRAESIKDLSSGRDALMEAIEATSRLLENLPAGEQEESK
jgi:hypothetical protein